MTLDRDQAIQLLEVSLYINHHAHEPKTSYQVVQDVSTYINDNYEHTFYTETRGSRAFMPFLLDITKEV